MNTRPVAITGTLLSEKCKSRLLSRGFRVLSLPPYEKLGKTVSAHTDLLVFIIENKIFTYGDYARQSALESLLSDTDYEIAYVSEKAESVYPKDVYLNALTVGNKIFARLDCLSSDIKIYAEKAGSELVNVKQGYARCTAVPLSDNAVITADPSITGAARANGIDILQISSGNVRLDGYDYGFIGGACGVFEDTVFFAGDLSLHPDGERIDKFCRNHGKEVVSLSDEPLYDVGSIFFIS